MMMAGVPDSSSDQPSDDQSDDAEESQSDTTLTEQDSIVDRAKHDLLDIIVILQANNLPQVKIEQLVNELDELGYDMDKEFVVDFLQNKPFVEKIDKSTVYLKTSERAEVDKTNKKQKMKDKVAKMAARALKKRK